MSLARLTTLLLLGTFGCGGTGSRSPQVAGDVDDRASSSERKIARDAEALRERAEGLMAHLEKVRNLRFVGMDHGPVPDFNLESVDGTELDSAELIGREPFVVAFFATWCDVCERKLRSLSRALNESGSMLVIPVSYDAPGSREHVERYLRSCGIAGPAVRAAEHPLLVMSYNPFGTIPLLVIVGQNGGLVDYQLGYEVEHERRLAASLRLAHVIPPLARPAHATEPYAP